MSMGRYNDSGEPPADSRFCQDYESDTNHYRSQASAATTALNAANLEIERLKNKLMQVWSSPDTDETKLSDLRTKYDADMQTMNDRLIMRDQTIMREGLKLAEAKRELDASRAREDRLGRALEHQSTVWGLYGQESKDALAEWRAAR